jgi:hypothetical protein
MRITVYNIDGSELARWYSDVVHTPYFKVPNHDPRCPYQIKVGAGERQPLETGIPLNHAIRKIMSKVKR